MPCFQTLKREKEEKNNLLQRQMQHLKAQSTQSTFQGASAAFRMRSLCTRKFKHCGTFIKKRGRKEQIVIYAVGIRGGKTTVKKHWTKED